jgi:hypothetical protein
MQDQIATTGNSDFSVGAKTHGKMCIPTEKCFSDGDRQKNTHGNRMTENLNFSVGSPSEKHISVGQALTEKMVSAESKNNFPCVVTHRKKINTDRKISFFCRCRSVRKTRCTHRKITIILSV